MALERIGWKYHGNSKHFNVKYIFQRGTWTTATCQNLFLSQIDYSCGWKKLPLAIVWCGKADERTGIIRVARVTIFEATEKGWREVVSADAGGRNLEAREKRMCSAAKICSYSSYGLHWNVRLHPCTITFQLDAVGLLIAKWRASAATCFKGKPEHCMASHFATIAVFWILFVGYRA